MSSGLCFFPSFVFLCFGFILRQAVCRMLVGVGKHLFPKGSNKPPVVESPEPGFHHVPIPEPFTGAMFCEGRL